MVLIGALFLLWRLFDASADVKLRAILADPKAIKFVAVVAAHLGMLWRVFVVGFGAEGIAQLFFSASSFSVN